MTRPFRPKVKVEKILVVALLVWEPDRLPMHTHMNFYGFYNPLGLHLMVCSQERKPGPGCFLSYVRGGDISENHKLLGKIGKNDFLSIIRK